MIDREMSPERFAQLAPAIQQKILNARAAAERREQKREDREALKSWLRLKELESIPVKQRSRDEHNEYQRLRRQQKKLEDRGEQTITERVEERVRTKEQFWALNRVSVSAKLPAWNERQEIVLDTLAWFDRLYAGTETPENCGENYLSAAEGLRDVLEDIEEHGVTHLGHVYDNPEIPIDWIDGFFTGRAFFRDAEVFRMLQQENKPTRVYVTTGIITALPDWIVVDYLVRHYGWLVKEANEAVGRKYDVKGNVFY